MVMNKDDPTVLMLGGIVRDSVSHDSCAPRKVGTFVEGAGIEPDLNAWGVDLGAAVTDVVRHNVEGSGRGFNRYVCPRVSVCIVGVSI